MPWRPKGQAVASKPFGRDTPMTRPLCCNHHVCPCRALCCEGNIALIEAAARKGEEQGRMPKFVLVTSIGTGDSQGAPPPQVYEVRNETPTLVVRSVPPTNLESRVSHLPVRFTPFLVLLSSPSTPTHV